MITFELNGKKIELSELGDVLERTVFEGIKETLESAIQEHSPECPDHGEPPAIVVRGSGVDNLGFEISCCCKKYEGLVHEWLDEEE